MLLYLETKLLEAKTISCSMSALPRTKGHGSELNSPGHYFQRNIIIYAYLHSAIAVPIPVCASSS